MASVESRQLALCAESESHETLSLAATDASHDQIVFATSCGSLICISRTAHQVVWNLLLFSGKDSVKDNIVGLEFMMDNEVLVVGTESGELFSVSVPTQSVEVVGNVEGGIMQMSASPDGELLAIATGLGMLLLMTSDWEVFYEIPLYDHTQLEASGLLRISWRSDGKYFATLDGGTRFSSEKELRIWERDTGTLHSRSKTFPSTSLGLDWIPNGSRLASAQSQDSTAQASRIIFFERNGLERGSFDIKGAVDASIECIKWSCNSELFAVLLKCGQFDAIQIWSFSNYHWYLKQEWHYSKENDIKFGWDPEKPMCLYTWTLSGQVQLLSLCWDSAVTGDSVALVIDGSFLLVTPLALGVVPPPMSFFQLKFCTSIRTVSFHQPGEGGSLVAASLSSGAISLVALPSVDKWDVLEGLESIIPDASFLEHTQTFPCMRLLSWLDSGTLVGIVSTDCNGVPLNSDSLWPPWEQPNYSRFELLLELEIYRGEESAEEAGLCKSNWSFKCINRNILDKRVLAMANHPSKELLIHFEDGSFSSYTSKRGLVKDVAEVPLKNLVFPSLWIQPLVAPASQILILIGLDEKGRLQVDSRVITKECTSFVVHRACINGKTLIHILHTTKQDVLLIDNVEVVLGAKECTGIVQDLSALSSKTNEKLAFGHKKQGREELLRARTVWERGSRLVTAVGGGKAAVILQTVRGNLETIYPRNLVIGSIVAALCESKFNEAVLLSRRHHINLNLIVDFQGWEFFMQQCVEFVRQVRNLNHVTELVCAVSAGNVTDNICQDLLLPFTKEFGNLNRESVVDNQPENPPKSTKVQSIMHAIRKALEGEVVASPKRELCILTTMARSDPPELEEALVRIKRLREEEMNQLIQEDGMNQSMENLSAEEALKHLLWLSDSKSVFNAALGLYDLHLAAMVAANSQGDPKEFLPLLQELEKMALPLMKYTIDHKLQRFEGALRNLAAAGSSHFNRCLELIRDHPNLFPIGKQLFKAEPERMAVLEAWGDYLLAEERFEDAAAAFSSCSQLHKALGAYRAGGLWQCVLVVAGVLGYAQEEVLRLAHELCEELQALGRPGDAARIALEHCKDPEDAVRLYIEAREWMEAVRVAYMCEEANLLDQIQSAALECASSFTTDFQEGLEKVGKYLARYLAVKQRRLLLEMKLKMGSPEDVEDDAASDVSSHVSGMSVYTTGTRSSKLSMHSSTRDRKQGGGKSRGGKIRAGSPGEEAALVEHLKGMKITDATLEGIQKLLQILILFQHDGVAEKLQRLVFQFQSSQQNAVLEADGSCGDDTRQSQWALEVLGTG